MAKRLTDTEKWKDDWYVSLNNDYRIIWQWLIDNCSHGGFCKRSMGILNLMCKTSIGENDLLETMHGRIIIHKNDWFIPGFLKFQYPTLHSQKPVILSVVRELFQKNAINLIPPEYGNDYIIKEKSFDNHYLMIKNKDKDKDKDDLTKRKNNGAKFSGNFTAQGQELYAQRTSEGSQNDSD